jgi:hypothetical protein
VAVRRAVLVVVPAAALLAAGSALGGNVERFRVVDAGHPETQSFPRDVFVTIESPGVYVAQSPGVWAGPAFWAASQPAQGGTATLEWSVGFRDRTLDPSRAAASVAASGWPEDQHNGISVPLLVDGKVVGTLPGFFVLTQAPAPDHARFEAGLAVPVGPGAQTVIRFASASPVSDSSPWGDYLVQGTFLASTWNRGQILLAMSQVRVEGNLAPKTVSIRVERGTRAVRGKVVDSFVNPLVGVPVAEERWNGSSWSPVRVGRTTAKGTYRLAAGRGRFRAVVSYAGTTATSAAVTIG